MLLTNWLRSIASHCRPFQPRHHRNKRSRILNRYQPALSRRMVGCEQLEDRTMLTSVISIDDVAEWEGDRWNRKTDFTFTVTRTGINPGDLNQELTIDFSTQDGTATLNDYLAQSGSIVFSANATSTSQSKSIVVQVDRDSEDEIDEFFEVILSTNNEDVTFEKNIGTGTILDDDIMVLDQAGRILPPESAVAGDHFGNAIAIDGDFMVVGAIESDLIADDAGAAYVYFRNRQDTLENDFDDVWEYQTTLTAFDAAAGDQFGSSVAIDGDTIVIGAYQDNGREFRSGTAYVYRWDGNNWNFEDKLIASDGRFNDHFGGDVTIENDVIVIGAAEKSPRIPDAPFYVAWAGQAYVFTRTGSDWSETQIITAPNQDTSDQFGWRVELENDTLFISGLKSDLQDSTADQGAIFVYQNINGTWTVQQTLVIPDGETNDLFGFDLDVDGDILGVISGATDESRRKAYVFENINGTWQYKYSLGTPGLGNNPSANSISVSGNSIAIGSILSDGYRSETGIVNIYHRKPLEDYWSLSEEIFAGYGYSNDYFGYAVAYSDSQLIIGVPQAPDSTRNAGELYLFEPHRPEVSFELLFQGTREDVSGQTAVRIYVTRSSNRGVSALNFDSTIYYHTVDGTATVADGDYQEQSGSITFTGDSNAGRQLEYFTIYINDDDEFEGFEEFYIQLTDDTGDVKIYFDQAKLLIFDNDYANINIENVTVDEDAGVAMVDVTLDHAIDTEVSVDFSTSAVSASESSDYIQTSGTLVFEPGVLTKTIAIPLVDTDEIEGDETFAVTLSNLQVSGALVQIGANPGIITIQDDDQANLSIDDLTVNESVGTATITVTLDEQVDTAVSVEFATSDQSAFTPDDYLFQTDTLTFNPGELSKTIEVPIVNSDLVESDETFFVNLSNLQTNGRNVILSDNQAVVTILDDDQGNISINDVSVDEAAGTSTITVSLDKPIDRVISVDYATANQSAIASDDYLPQSGTLTFNPGEQTKTITVPIVNSDLVEADEIFLINLSDLQSNGANVIISDDQAEITIQDDDQASIAIDDISVNESAGTAMLTVSLDKPVSTAVSVDFSTEDQSAFESEDYLFQTGTVTFNPGEQTQTFSISLVDSPFLEPDESFLVNLSNIQSNGADVIFTDDQAQVTILDDDKSQLSISDLTVNEADGTATVLVTLDLPLDVAVSVDFITADQSAKNSVDYLFQSGTVTFDPGEQSKTIAITILNNSIVEPQESFLVNLRNMSTTSPDVILFDDQAEVTIIDDDQAQVSIDDISVDESAGTARLKVSLNRTVLSTINVDYATADNSAETPTDYVAQSGTLSFFPGQRSQYFTVPIVDSSNVENIESFFINLANIQANGAQVTIGDDQAKVTILDDDQANLSIDDITVDEADGTATLTVTLDQPVETVFTVDFASADQAAVHLEDYLSVSDTLTFNPGDQSKTITVSIINSDQVESDETFLVNLTNIQANGANVFLLDDQAKVTINDDDQAKISIDDISVNENAETATLTVSLDQSVDSSISVNFATADQSAIDTEDYLAASGTLTFDSGEQSKTITISIVDSDLLENDETFLVNLTNIQANGLNIIFADDQAEVTILDDEVANAEMNLRIVKAPTDTGPEGEIATLTDNQNKIHEWSVYWVEIWVNVNSRTDQGIFSAQLDLDYNTEYTSATEIEFGAGFTQNQAGSINEASGAIEGLYAETTASNLGTENYLLFARIKFEPLAEDQVELDIPGKSLGPHDFGFQASSPEVNLVGHVPVTTNLGQFNGVSVYANPYDLNDDDTINFRDLTNFVSTYNSIPSESDSDYAWFADLDKNDQVNFQDLVLFVNNYNKTKLSQSTIIYPEEVPQSGDNNLTVNAQTEPKSKAKSITQATAESVLENVVEQVSPQLTPDENEKLENIEIQVVDLEGDLLGQAIPGTIYIDVNAAGYGWFVDTTPNDHSEFQNETPLSLIALPDSEAADRVDLWSVIMHEVGHILGHDHEDEGLMEETLEPGVRKLPVETENTDSFFSSLSDETELMPF